MRLHPKTHKTAESGLQGMETVRKTCNEPAPSCRKCARFQPPSLPLGNCQYLFWLVDQREHACDREGNAEVIYVSKPLEQTGCLRSAQFVRTKACE